MPSRYLREGFLDSEQIEAVDDASAVLWVRLVLVADDYARFDGRLSVIERACWPNDKNVPDRTELQRRLDALANAKSRITGLGLIERYEVSGKPYLFIPKFGQRTRAVKSKYPDLPQDLQQNDAQPENVSGDPPTDGGRGAGRWRQPDSSPRAGSRSVSRSSSANDGQGADKRRTDRETAGERKTRENRENLEEAAKHQTAPPTGSATELLKQAVATTRAAAPPAPPAREISDWRATSETIDHQGQLLGMQRLKLETDNDYVTRIQARMNLG